MTAAAPRTGFWLVVAVACTGIASAFFAFPIPLVATLAIAAFAALSFLRPFDSLLLLAAFTPIAGAVHALSGLYYGSAALIEVCVLAFLTGATLRAALHRSVILATPFDAALTSFAAVAAASVVAQMPTLLASSVDPAEALVRLVRREYFLHDPAYVAVQRSALLIGGAALAGAVARVCRRPGMASRLAAMMVLGGTAAAALNVYRWFEVSLRNPPFLEASRTVLLSVRFNTQFGDLNAAGSFFAMMTILATARAGLRSRSGRFHAAASPVLLFALWISGSRVALAATLLSLLMVFVLRRHQHALSQIRLSSVLVAGSTLLTLLVLVVFLLPTTRHGSFGFSLNTRVELLKVGGRMMQDRPIFGVGSAQFYALFPRYTSEELLRDFEQANGRPIPRENAHNQFVQFGAELGLVGLSGFVLLLITAVAVGLTHPARLPELAALGGFLITALAGHPLLTPLVSWPFWLMTGLVASGGTDVQPAIRRRLGAAVTGVVLCLIAAMPLRWGLERREADLTGVRAGLSEWARDERGMRFQYGGQRSSVFVSRDSRQMRVPLRSADGRPHRVEVRLDGRPASAVNVVPDAWRELVLPLPTDADAPASRRVDLIVSDASDVSERLLMVGQVFVPGS